MTPRKTHYLPADRAHDAVLCGQRRPLFSTPTPASVTCGACLKGLRRVRGVK
jgi:hypothetical protein